MTRRADGLDVFYPIVPDFAWLERLVQGEDEEDRTGADLNEIYLDDRSVVPDLRTSLMGNFAVEGVTRGARADERAGRKR
jgi:hypothetical protein